MKKYTRKALKITWGDKHLVQTRAKRGPGTSAPIKEELKIYEFFAKKALNQKAHPKALILGATPEIRDLAIMHGYETYSVDISKKLLKAMTDVMIYKDSKQNKIIHGDWLELENYFKAETFNIILGDAPLNNIPFNTFQGIFRSLHKLLKKNSYLVLRQLCYEPQEIFEPINTIIERYKKNKSTITGLYFELMYNSNIAKKAYDSKTRTIGWNLITNKVLEIMKNHLQTSDLEYAKNFASHAKVHKSIVIPKKEFKELIEENFSKVKIFDVNEHPFSKKFIPIFSAKKL